MKNKIRFSFAAVFALLFMSMLSSCYVGYYGGPRRGYYNRGPHRAHYPHHYHHGYHGRW